MKCRVIVLYGIYQVSDPDRGIQFLTDLSDNCLLWGLSCFDLPAGKFPAAFKFSVASCGGKYFGLCSMESQITAATTRMVFIPPRSPLKYCSGNILISPRVRDEHFHGHLRDRFHFTIIVFLLAICRFHNIKLSHIIKTSLCITLFHQQMFSRSRQNLLHIRLQGNDLYQLLS